MRRDVFSRLQRLPVNYFDQRSSGDLMTRVIEDVNSVERILIDGTELGRWVIDHIADQAMRPNAGTTGIDPCVVASFPGAPTGV